jgi:high-affinity iron transporter
MLLAAVVLTWMIFWMQAESATLSESLAAQVRTVGATRRGVALFLLAFLSIFREGLELSLFLTATAFSSDPANILLGAIFGLLLAIGVGWALSKGLLRLNLRRFFLSTSILLILVAGGLVAHGIHEFNEAALVPAIIDHVWDINPLIDETSPVGQLLTALFGYNANPSLSEVLGASVYYSAILLYLIQKARPTQRKLAFPEQ